MAARTLAILASVWLRFTSPGVLPDSSDGCLNPGPLIPDWRPSVTRMVLWGMDDPPGSEVTQTHETPPAGSPDSFLVVWDGGPATACVEVIRWNGMKSPCRACVPLGVWPVSVPVSPRWTPRPEHFDPGRGRRIFGPPRNGVEVYQHRDTTEVRVYLGGRLVGRRRVSPR